MIEELKNVLADFKLSGECKNIQPLKKGHINDTFVSTWEVAGDARRYLHQRINHAVFPDVPALMANVVNVINHLEKKISSGEQKQKTLTLVATKKNEWFTRAANGNYWRTYELIPDAESYHVCTNSKQARDAARLCGEFQSMLSDCVVEDFNVVIPDFHNTAFRYQQLEAAVKVDSHKRVSSAKAEIDFALERKARSTSVIADIQSGIVPLRVTHNDLKFNNVLFDSNASVPLALVDLDTCMPGSILYDFGDLVRNTSVPAAEDEPDRSKIFLDIEFFQAITEGYCAGVGNDLTNAEWDLLYYAPQLLTLTIGIRFLTDFLSGDTYFKTDYPEHNLVRARSQFKIVESMEEHEEEMKRIVAKVRKEVAG